MGDMADDLVDRIHSTVCDECGWLIIECDCRSVVCAYCGDEAELVTGKEMYPHRPDLHTKVFWRCEPCRAWVGCHPGSEKPLGRLANAELRSWKQLAHRTFDPLWRSGKMSRKGAYALLASRMGLPSTQAHIGMFDVDQCRRVVQLFGVAKEW